MSERSKPPARTPLPRSVLLWAVAGVQLAGCAGQVSAPAGEADDPIKAAFVVLGPDGAPVARVITASAMCPDLEIDGARVAMQVRAAPATVPQRPTASASADSKASVFPVAICEASLPRAARRAAAGGHPLPLPKAEPRRIVVIGDSGCRLKLSDREFQSCNDPAAWPFAEVAAAAAAKRPDLVIHVGDYHYRENACPSGDRGCAGSPWGYGWDAWDADFFGPARPLLAVAPWIVVRGNHESCSRAGQGWWRFLDPRPLVPRRDCNDPANDAIGDYSEPYGVVVGADTLFTVFDSSRVGTRALSPSAPMYQTYSAQLRQAFALARGVAHSVFLDHHPVLGFEPNPSQKPTGLYPGNEALQSILRPIAGDTLFPPNVEALIAGHVHLFEMVSFATAQPAQIITGSAGAWANVPLPMERARAAQPAPGATIESIVSTSEYGFLTMERGADGAWNIDAWDRRGGSFTRCTLRDAKARCAPESLP